MQRSAKRSFAIRRSAIVVGLRLKPSQNLTLHRGAGENDLEQSPKSCGRSSWAGIRLRGRLERMKISVYRTAGGWAVRTAFQELLFSSIHEAMSAATKYAKARNYEAADFGSGDV